MREVLESGGIDTGGVVACEGVRATVKTRVIAERQQVVRIDREDSVGITGGLREQLAKAVLREAARASGIIMEDYGKGMLEQSVVDLILSMANNGSIPVGYDPKGGCPLRVNGVAIATPNRKEAFSLSGFPERDAAADPLSDTPLLDVAARLREAWRPRALLITLGPQGCC